MAQTQTKTKKRSTSKGASASAKSKSQSAKSKSSKPKSQSKPKAAKKAAKPKSSSSKSRSSNGSRSSSGNGSSGGTSPLEAVRNAVGGAGQTVGKAAGKAKVPLVAGGAAIAGAAGGLALAASKQGRKKGLKSAMPHRPKIKFNSGDVAKAAKEVGNFSAQVGELANELQRARESADGKHRSPVEVVLQGLTARR